MSFSCDLGAPMSFAGVRYSLRPNPPCPPLMCCGMTNDPICYRIPEWDKCCSPFIKYDPANYPCPKDDCAEECGQAECKPQVKCTKECPKMCCPRRKKNVCPVITWPDPPKIDMCCSTNCPKRTIDICYMKVCQTKGRCCPTKSPCAVNPYSMMGQCCNGKTRLT